MIVLESGLKNSLMVLEHLRNREELKDIPIEVGTFTNCRECGLTFKVAEEKAFTWCVYEHRNSDEIILNGKEGHITLSGDLPYKGNSKYDYIASFKFNQHYECAEKLAKLIIAFHEKIKGIKQ